MFDDDGNPLIRVGADLYEEVFNEQKNKGLQPEFRRVRELNVYDTEQKKEPVWYDMDICIIHNTSDPNSRAVHPVTDEIKRRFPKQYAEWAMRQNGLTTNGTPLREWPLFPAENASIYEAFGISTVELAAEVGEAMMAKLPEGRAIQAKAKAWLAKNKDIELEAKIRLENDELRDRLTQLESLLKSKESEPPKRGPGRPPKAETEHATGEAA